MDSQDIDSIAERYYYSIRAPGGLTRSQVRMEATKIYGHDSEQIMGRLDQMLAEATPLQSVSMHGFLGERKKGGILGLGILDGSILQRQAKKPKPAAPATRGILVIQFDNDGTYQNTTDLAARLDRMAKTGAKIIEYRSYAVAEKETGILTIPERKGIGTPFGILSDQPGKEGILPPTTVHIPPPSAKHPGTVIPPTYHKWAIQIYLKKPYAPKYSQTPDITFFLRTPDEHRKVDMFFQAVRSGEYEFMSTSAENIKVTLRARQK